MSNDDDDLIDDSRSDEAFIAKYECLDYEEMLHRHWQVLKDIHERLYDINRGTVRPERMAELQFDVQKMMMDAKAEYDGF